MYPIYAFILFAQFLHNNLVKFCCARLNIFKLCTLKALILKGFDRHDLPVIVRHPEESSYLRNIKKTYLHHKDVLSLFLLPYKLVI